MSRRSDIKNAREFAASNDGECMDLEYLRYCVDSIIRGIRTGRITEFEIEDIRRRAGRLEYAHARYPDAAFSSEYRRLREAA